MCSKMAVRSFNMDDAKFFRVKEILKKHYDDITDSPTKIVNRGFDLIISKHDVKSR